MPRKQRSPAPLGGRAPWNVHASERPQDNRAQPPGQPALNLRQIVDEGGRFVCLELMR